MKEIPDLQKNRLNHEKLMFIFYFLENNEPYGFIHTVQFLSYFDQITILSFIL